MSSVTPNDVYNFLQHLKPIYDPLPRRISSRRARRDPPTTVLAPSDQVNLPLGAKHGGNWVEVNDKSILEQYSSTYDRGLFEYLPHTADIQIHSCKY
jgi:hypothetical protein